MPLNLADIMKKAKAKGIGISTKDEKKPRSLRHWQQESVLFSSIKSVAEQGKTEHKPDTNRTQTEHQNGHKPDTNRTQQKEGENTNRTQTGHRTGHKPGHKPDTNRTQTRGFRLWLAYKEKSCYLCMKIASQLEVKLQNPLL